MLCCLRSDQFDAHFCLLDKTQTVHFIHSNDGGEGRADETQSEEVVFTEALVCCAAFFQ